MALPEHVTLNDTSILPTSRSSVARQAFRWTTAFYGPGAPANVALHSMLRIGRDPKADLWLDDPSVSRDHAVIHTSDEHVFLEDLGSSNGTYVNAHRVKNQAKLHDGAIVRIGKTLLRVALRTEPWVPSEPSLDLVGGSDLAGIRRQISLVGPTSLSVLILGETGTGKDVAARLLHEKSQRFGPFIPVNCAALSEAFAESELFGHVRGAFTGAHARTGLFAAAHGGTLFLDEVGELPLSVQPKLLRVLEDGIVRPLGSEKSRKYDVRVISATHRDLAGSVHGGSFRADLLARLAGVEIRLPRLHDHPEDIPALCSYLLTRAGAGDRELDLETMEALAIYDWPMNVRELDSVLRNALLTSHGVLPLTALPIHSGASRHIKRVTYADDKLQGNRTQGAGVSAGPAALLKSLKRHNGNIRRVCMELGFSRTHVYRLLKRWEIDHEKFRYDGYAGREEFEEDGDDHEVCSG